MLIQNTPTRGEQEARAAELALQELLRIEYYKFRPADYLIKFLGFRPETLYWSMLPEYASHGWDSTIQYPGKEAQPCPDPLVAFLNAWFMGFPYIAMESATGTGKTYTVAGGALAWLDTHRPGIFRTYAPNEQTLEKNMWAYLGDHFKRFKELHPQAFYSRELTVFMDPESENRHMWSATGYLAQVSAGGQVEHGAQSSAGAQGGHSEHMCNLIEEAPGVDRRIWNALKFTQTDQVFGEEGEQLVRNQLVGIGNPDADLDALHEFWKWPDTVKIRLSGKDTPNYVTRRTIVPGGFSREFEQFLLRNEFKGNDQDPLFLSRTRGICPTASGACLFSPQALEAVKRYHTEAGPSGEERWREPLLEVEITPARWRKCLLEIAQAGGWGPGIDLETVEIALGSESIEGVVQFAELPKYDVLGRYVVGLDVASEGGSERGQSKSRHGGLVFDVVEQRFVGLIDLQGPRQLYAMLALAMARIFAVPKRRGSKREQVQQAIVEKIGERGAMLKLWQAEQRRLLGLAREPLVYEPGVIYPVMAHETNGVGALQVFPPYLAYPKLYRRVNKAVKGAKPTKKIGWATTHGKTGTRVEVEQTLKEWGALLVYQPSMLPFERLFRQCQTFVRDERSGTYKAASGSRDDLVMGGGIAECIALESPRTAEALAPKEGPGPQVERRGYPGHQRKTKDPFTVLPESRERDMFTRLPRR